MRELTKDERADLEAQLAQVKETQSAFWMALDDLETMLNGVELDGSADFEGYTVDDLLEREDNEYAGPPDAPGWEGGFADNH